MQALCNVSTPSEMNQSISNLIYWSFPNIYYTAYTYEYVNGANYYKLNCSDPANANNTDC